ncbi:MAG: redoxin domain-containing protein, partial [Clostridia bacterium]|nr:redoxin domain-containing protein [Clostridia bacterium]
MKKTTTLRGKLFAFVACVLLLAMCLAACTPDETSSDAGSESSETSQVTGQTAEHTVSIKTAGGMAMSEIKVDIYKDDTLADMLDFAKTGETGEVSFTLATGGNYAIVVSGAPKGYVVEKSYRFDGTHADIVLTSSLVTDEELSTATLGLGDVMYDFTVTATDGKEIKLSELLKTKDLVVLNFWYTTCSWCLTEFPIMDEVYKEYGDRMEFVALDPLDDKTAVERFRQEQGLSFPMASCPASWANTFGVTGYPTSVFIDRYGVITLVESGAITSKRPFLCAFDHFLAENYKQKLCTEGIGELVTQVKPTYTMDSSEAIGELINSGDIDVTYRPETEDDNAEYIWPFIAGEKLGKDALYASNKGVDDSYAILYADVTLKKGQAVGFDYIASSERFADIMFVIVNDVDVYQISGVSESEEWRTCYPCVADEDGVYEIALCFMKDTDTAEGDDTVYISNMRVVDAKDIDADTFLPRQAATTTDGETYSYVDIFYNENDGYYHVGSENGPLLLADLMGYTPFAEELTVYDIVYNGNADKDGVSLYNYVKDGGLGMVKYFSYASNSGLNGVCTVNKELAEMLKQVAEVAGFDGTENEWLK